MRWVSNHVVVRALLDEAIWFGLEPNQPEPTVPTIQQGERHKLGAAELLAMRQWCCSTSVEDLEVEEWVDSLPLRAPPPLQSSCDGGRSARVLLARELSGLRWRRADKAHKRRWWGRVSCGCGGARGCLQRRLGLGVSEWVVESKRVPTGDIQTSVLAVGLRARQERCQCWRVA
jgi:hypothetical protein